jgi:tRNA U34 5-carboxymethylaminomethyl modifying GTPase MnmE/TrmE
VRRAREKFKEADLKICMFDAATYPELETMSLSLIDENTLVLLNKIDTLPPER